MMQHAHLVLWDHAADGNRIQSPLGKNPEDLIFAAVLGHQQHALLRFAQHDLVRGHAGLALGHAVKFDFQTHPAASAHLTGGAGEAGGTHILNADDGARFHGFEACFQQ